MPLDRAGLYVIVLGNGEVLSVQPNGSFQTRPPSTQGSYEVCTLDATVNVVRFNPAGIVFPVAIRGV